MLTHKTYKIVIKNEDPLMQDEVKEYPNKRAMRSKAIQLINDDKSFSFLVVEHHTEKVINRSHVFTHIGA